MLARMQTIGNEPLDEDLLARIVSRDEAAFALLLERHTDNVRSLAWRLLQSHSDVDDITQDIFLKLWNKPQSFTPGKAKFSTWLYRVTMNAAIDRQRRNKPLTTLETVEATLADNKPNAETMLIEKSRSQQVADAIAKLPSRQAQAISLSHFQGVSNIEAAEILDTSVEAVESLLGRARRALKAALKPQIDRLIERGN